MLDRIYNIHKGKNKTQSGLTFPGFFDIMVDIVVISPDMSVVCFNIQMLSLNTSPVNNDNSQDYEIVPAKKGRFREPYYMAFLRAQGDLAKMDLCKSDYRLYLYLVSLLGYENYLIIAQREIAKELDMHPPNVSRSLKVLIEKGIIEHMRFKNGSRGYRLSPTIGWRGHADKIKWIGCKEE